MAIASAHKDLDQHIDLKKPSANGTRRAELGRFLKASRSRISPDDVGLPPGPRRRTPGLRREEVALLAGVGVTWYTWLEQGRPINASTQVLDAVAQTLRLDQAGRWHLYRLAEAMPVRSWTISDVVPEPVLEVRVNAVCPTFVRTEMTDRSIAHIVQRTGRSAEQAEAALAAASPLGRLLEPEEVADAIVHLASPAAAAISGQAWVLDGGGIQA